MKDRHPVVRSARREDGPRIIELDRELALFEKLPPPDDVEAERLLSWIFESKKLEALVAELKGRIEGVALFYEGLGSFRARPFLYLEDLVISSLQPWKCLRPPDHPRLPAGVQPGGLTPKNSASANGAA